MLSVRFTAEGTVDSASSAVTRPPLDRHARSASGDAALDRHLRGIGLASAIRRDALGAPRADGALHLSLSYTPGLIATAVSDEAPCGVDVEPMDRALPHGFADDRERAVWAAQSLPLIGIACAKEAIGKTLGFGLLAEWRSYQLTEVRALSPERTLVTAGAYGFVEAVVGRHGSLCLALATVRARGSETRTALLDAVAAAASV